MSNKVEQLRESGQTVMTVDDLVELLDGRIGRTALYDAIRRGEVPGVLRLGRKVLLSVPVVVAWLLGERDEAPPDGKTSANGASLRSLRPVATKGDSL